MCCDAFWVLKWILDFSTYIRIKISCLSLLDFFASLSPRSHSEDSEEKKSIFDEMEESNNSLFTGTETNRTAGRFCSR